MTSPFVHFFENVNLSSSYDRLSPNQIWFNLDQGNQSYEGGGRNPLPQVENVLNRPGEIGLTLFDMGAMMAPQNVFDHCAQTLRRRKLKLGDF